jgi:hypothetical protein
MDATVEDMMDGIKYNSENANEVAIRMAEKLRSRILALKFDRFVI